MYVHVYYNLKNFLQHSTCYSTYMYNGNYTIITFLRYPPFVPLAFPTTNPMFTIPNINFAPLGSSPVIHCSFLPGLLTEYYEVMWYRGVSLLDTASVESRFKETDNLTLTIQDVNLEDASDSYYCELFIRDPQTDVVRSGLGYDVSLTVYGMSFCWFIGAFSVNACVPFVWFCLSQLMHLLVHLTLAFC